MDWISELWRDCCLGDEAFWKSATFWLTAAAIVLPFGSLLFVFKLQPVRVRHFRRYFRRDS
jgi:hypothetical protein